MTTAKKSSAQKSNKASQPKKQGPEFDREKLHSIDEAVKIVKAAANAKFDETIEIAVNLGVDPRHADQTVRGVVDLPHGTGKSIRVAVVAPEAKQEEAKKAGADLVGGAELVDAMVKGTQALDFDRLIATPDMMVALSKAGKVLGPKGLMPNPKLGTVTPNIADAVTKAKAGSIEFRAEKAGIIHAGVGKVSFDEAKLAANIRAVIEALNKAKPSGVKGTYMKKMSVSSTMGPGVKIDLASLAA